MPLQNQGQGKTEQHNGDTRSHSSLKELQGTRWHLKGKLHADAIETHQ